MRSSILLAVLSAALLSGCGWSFPFLPSNPPDRQFNHFEHETITPAYVTLPDGKILHVTYKVERDYSVGLNQSQPKIPGWRRVLNALFGWSFIGGIILLVLTILGIPAVPALFLAIRRVRSANKHLSQIVAGVDQGLGQLPPEQQEKFKAELSKTYDSDTKKEVVRFKEGV